MKRGSKFHVTKATYKEAKKLLSTVAHSAEKPQQCRAFQDSSRQRKSCDRTWTMFLPEAHTNASHLLAQRADGELHQENHFPFNTVISFAEVEKTRMDLAQENRMSHCFMGI